MRVRVQSPRWGRAPAVAALLVCAAALPAVAQPRDATARDAQQNSETNAGARTDSKTSPKRDDSRGKKGAVKEQTFNFEGLGLSGRSRSPQLLYFLERASEELERASLEKRSFLPHLVRSVEEEAL